jgi:dTMP kinase
LVSLADVPHPKASPPPALDAVAVQQAHDLTGVLRISTFRRLWIALSLSSLGDWLGLLATAALATALGGQGYADRSYAVAGVFVIRLVPAILLGPIAGVIADRFDRRWTMVVCDVLRFSLFVSIPIVRTLWWLYAASFFIECASMMWIPAKEATVPNLVPKQRLESANQLSLLTTYGTAPLAASLFTLLSLFSGLLGAGIPFFSTNPVDLALYFDAATFLFSALTIFRLREITRIRRTRQAAVGAQPTVLRTLIDGWAFVGKTPVVRGLITGMVGAFAAGGAVVGLAPIYVQDLGAGNAAYGVLFGTVFTGLAVGMFIGPRTLKGFSRHRLFGLSICGASVSVALVALVQNIVLAVIFTFVLGAFAGVGWVTGYTLLGLEVSDEMRGRTFAFVQSLVRIVLILVLAVAPVIAGAFGRHELELTDDVSLTYNGSAITFFIAGLLGTIVGVASFRQMDDRPGVSLLADVVSALRGNIPAVGRPYTGGFFIAIEGGEGAGKSTQAALLGDWLRDKGHEVVLTREPGATRLGRRLRDVLLSPVTGNLTPRAEALMYAADRAEHVASVIRPALERGAVVVTDRYADSSVAYQGAGRALPSDEVVRLCRWATDGLVPNLTVILDVPPQVGLGRVTDELDRLEAEPIDFHRRVREEFLRLAEQHPERYLVVDADRDPEAVFAAVRERLDGVLPLSPRERVELEERRRREEEEARQRAEFEARQAALAEERQRLEEQRRRGEEERARLAAAEEARRRAEEEARRRAEEEARRRVEEEQRRLAAEEARRLAEEEARRRAEEEARRRADELARRNAEEAERRRIEVEARHKAEEEARRWREQLDDTDELSLADELLGPWHPDPEPLPDDQHGRHVGRNPDAEATEELPRVGVDDVNPRVSPDDETHRFQRVAHEGETHELPPVRQGDENADKRSDDTHKLPRIEP